MEKQPSYKTHDPRGWCGDPHRGAAMGRGSLHTEASASVKLALRRININSGGYDPNGTYYGLGAPLYWYADTEGKIDACLRAQNRDAAKRQIREQYPHARFYR